jgi:hypothetical protein
MFQHELAILVSKIAKNVMALKFLTASSLMKTVIKKKFHFFKKIKKIIHKNSNLFKN